MGFCVNCHNEQQGAERLPDLSLTDMDRRSFIKLTAITGTSADARELRQSREPAHPLRPGRRHRARRRRRGSRASARCARRLRPDRPRHGRRRRGRPRRPGGRRADAAWPRSSKGNPTHPVNHGGLCARGQAAIQVTYHPDRITQPLKRTGDARRRHVRGDHLGRRARRARRAARRARRRRRISGRWRS